MTATSRIDAVTALFAAPFVAGLLLLGIFAVAWVCRAERLHRERRNRLPLGAVDFMAPWSDREPGDLDVR